MTTAPGLADQATRRPLFRAVGCASLAIATVLLGIALADFVGAMNSNDFGAAHTRLWLFFVAMPFVVLGGAALRQGFLAARHCSHCGKRSDARARFCDACGTRLA